jgi:hypothetical protein
MSGAQFKHIPIKAATALPVSQATPMRFGFGVGVLRERVRQPVPSAARNDYFGGKQAALRPVTCMIIKPKYEETEIPETLS